MEGDLTTLTNAQAWLSIASPSTAQSATLSRLIRAASTKIQAYLGYQVLEAEYERCFDGVGGAKIMLPDRPVIEVTSVTIDGRSVPAAAMPSSGFVFDAMSVGLVGGHRFTRGLQNVVVAYTAGYACTPPDIEQACLEWVSGSFQAQLRDPALTEIKAGDTAEKYGATSSVLGTTLLPMPPEILAALLPYRRVSSW